MSDITNLIKESTCDIIAITTIWALLNNPDIPLNYFKYNNNEIYNINPTYKTIFGVGISLYIISKYY
jgi:hypothetical protein